MSLNQADDDDRQEEGEEDEDEDEEDLEDYRRYSLRKRSTVQRCARLYGASSQDLLCKQRCTYVQYSLARYEDA